MKQFLSNSMSMTDTRVRITNNMKIPALMAIDNHSLELGYKRKWIKRHHFSQLTPNFDFLV